MSISLDKFLDRRRTPSYKCYQHAAEVWEHITGEKLDDRLDSYVTTGVVSCDDARGFKHLAQPVSPCLVLMENRASDTPHLGVFFENKVMHLADYGATYDPLHIATFGFRKVRFYK